MTYRIQFKKTLLGFAAALLLLPCDTVAQSTLSQNQDGFNGETMDGFMNTDPDKDSTVVERTVSHDYSQFVINTNTGLPEDIQPDTLHHSFHNAHLTEGYFGTYSHLGNMGSPRLSRLYFEREESKDFIFDLPYDYWIKDAADFRFTDAKSPHVSIDYYKGGNKRTGEEHIKGYFAANFNKRSGIGFDLDYLLGRGRYTNQSTSMFDARLYTYYRGDIYQMYVSVNRDNIKVAENGGIQDTRYIKSPEAMAEGRKQYSPEDIPFRIYDNWNNIKRTQGLFNQELSLKKTTHSTDSIGDTVYTFTRVAELGKAAHTLEVGQLQRRYIYYQIPRGFYSKSYLKNDSLDLMKNFYVSNTLSMSLLEGSTKWAIAGLSAFAKYEFRSFVMPDTMSTSAGKGEYMRRYNEGDFSVGGQLEKAQGDNLTFRAGIETVLLGASIGDFSLSGQMELKYPIWGREAKIGAYADMSAKESPFYYSNLHSTYAWWDGDFKKEFRTRFGGYIDLEMTGTRFQLDVENVANYVYLKNIGGSYLNEDSVRQPTYSIKGAQHNGSIQILSATLQQNFKLGPLHWDNHITYQLSGNKEIIPLPDLNIFSDLYFKFIYYKRLHMEVGVNALYFTRYKAPGYCPAVGAFHLQSDSHVQEVGGYPLLSGYVNCMLRGVRFYIMYYHFNDGLMSNRDSFIVPGYPANPGMVKFGLSWTFFD
ncbi:MAG: putative porin [Bacteroidaceae bacterium]|nr:putative porin [Bacteroidaceae bacterium]